MKSRITIEVDFENGNQPYIRVSKQGSDDVRDKLLTDFLLRLNHQSSWLRIDYSGTTEDTTLYRITPISLSDLAEQARLMNLIARGGRDHSQMVEVDASSHEADQGNE